MYRGGHAGGAAAAALNDSHSKDGHSLQAVQKPKTEAERQLESLRLLQFSGFFIGSFVLLAVVVLVGNAVEQYYKAKKDNK